MNKNVFLISAICLATTTVLSAETSGLIPPRYNAAHAAFPLSLSQHSSAPKRGAAVNPNAEEVNVHVALWRTFDVRAAVNGTQPSGINDFGEITGAYFDAINYAHGFVRKADGWIVTFDAPKVGYPTAFSGTVPTGINNRGDVVGAYTD